MNYLKRLAARGSNSDSSAQRLKNLTVSERFHCCIVAFKVMKSNLDALNVDLQDFFVQLYNLVLEYRLGRDQGEVLTEALKIMLCDDRQHDMQKMAAFVKCLATFSLCFGSVESMAALVTLKYLLQKNVKCQNLLENYGGGGSVSRSIAESFNPQGSTQKSNNKRKRGTVLLTLASIEPTSIDENEVSKKLGKHFMLLWDIKKNERLRGELDQTTSALQLYEEYKKQRKSAMHRTKKSKNLLPVN
ncbi:hypothetical protein REPUB_Repub05bG0001100 [Reevesia pubescens]